MNNAGADTLKVLQTSDDEERVFIFQNAIRPVGIGAWLRSFEGDAEYEDIQAEVYKIEAHIASRPGNRLIETLRVARNTALHPIEWQDADEPCFDSSPKWSSGCDAVDDVLDGGLYGVTVIAGAPKVGKSLMSISAAVCAARAGWRVIYCNAELSRSQMSLRLQNFMGAIEPEVVERLSIANVTTGVTIDNLCRELEERVALEDERLLIVLDSINRVCDMGQADESENGYWSLLRDWSAWAMNSRRSSEGSVSWLIVSELAQHGGVKGRSLEYLADAVVRINATSADDIVDVDVPYSRATRSGTVGVLRRDFGHGLFERCQ
tara:strand:+ start:1397 stop:2359 length:963 start_codon:yes stop_codon:yes gene_type:complete